MGVVAREKRRPMFQMIGQGRVHIGIVVSRHHAHPVRRAQRGQEGRTGIEFGRQAHIHEVAGDGDMIRLLRQEVGLQRRER